MTTGGRDLEEVGDQVVQEIWAVDELRDDPDWESMAMVVEVDDHRCAISAYRYAGSGRPLPTEEPEVDDLFWDLRDRARDEGGPVWDVVVVRFDRATGRVALRFLQGTEAALFRVTPANIGHLPESIRPRPDDFGPA